MARHVTRAEARASRRDGRANNGIREDALIKQLFPKHEGVQIVADDYGYDWGLRIADIIP